MRTFCLCSIIALLFLIGCSGNGNPILSDVRTSPSSAVTGSLDSIPMIGLTTNDDGSFHATGLLGAYELKLDTFNFDAEIVSKRIPSLGESWIVNGMSFFAISPCTDCFKLSAIQLNSDGLLEIAVSIKHPFPPGDPYNPPTGKNRLDLDIFDVAVVLYPQNETSVQYPQTGASAYSGFVSNADGYTIELADLIGDVAALPYTLVIDDSVSGASTWNKFAMGSEFTFWLKPFLQRVSSPTYYDIYLTMGYGASATKAQRLDPKYFNPEFNRKPAWKVEVTPPEGTNPPSVGNTWDDSDTTTPYPVTVKVWDWQHGVTTIANPPVNPEDIAFASDVTDVSVEIPGMTTSLQHTSTPTGGTGTPSDPLIFTISFPNQNQLAEGIYIGLVKVSDSRVPSSSPTPGTPDLLIDIPQPGALAYITIPEFATYQTFAATVVAGGQPPICDLVLSKYNAGSGETIFANPGTSYDPDGVIMSYEYDTNYDSVNFTPDITQNSGDPDFGDPVSILLPCATVTPITVTIALRVCDDSGTPGLCTICTQDVNVSIKLGTPGNLIVKSVNRGEGAVNPNLITSITLDWPDNPCAVEYVIERSLNGWTGTGYSMNGISTIGEYKYNLAGVDWDEDYRFRVYARAVVGGNPTTDSPYSEEVFVLFHSNAGSLAIPQNNFTWYRKNTTTFTVYGTSLWGAAASLNADAWPSSGSIGVHAIGCTSNAIPDQWGINRSPQPVPDLVGQSEAWWDGYISGWGQPEPPTFGFVVGSLTNPVPTAGTVLCDFIPASTILDPTYYPYNQANTGVVTEFCVPGQMAWNVPIFNWRHVGYYVNELCDDGTRNYLAFGGANANQYPATSTAYILYDAWAFVVQ